MKALGERCNVTAKSTVRWHHQLFKAVQSSFGSLKRVVDTDETYALESQKWESKLNRKGRKRISVEGAPYLVEGEVAVYPLDSVESGWAFSIKRALPSATELGTASKLSVGEVSDEI